MEEEKKETMEQEETEKQTSPEPDVSEELERLKKQLSDKDRYITELADEKATLEARLSETPEKKEKEEITGDVASILEEAQIDPEKAGEKLAKLIKNATAKAQQDILANLQPIVEQQTYVSKIKAENQDLIDLGLEPAITLRAQNLMKTGKSFKAAVDIAVKEAREKIDKLKKPSDVPPGAKGEKAANKVSSAPPPKELTPEDEIRLEKERRRKLGL